MKFKIEQQEEIINTTFVEHSNMTPHPRKTVRFYLYKWGSGIYFDERLGHETCGAWVFVSSYEDRETAKRMAEFISQTEELRKTLKSSEEIFEI